MADRQHLDQALRLLRRESDAFVATLASLAEDDWNRPTSCPPWTVRQLAAHVVRQVEAYIGAVEAGQRGDLGAVESRETRVQVMNRIAAQEPARIVADFRQSVDQFESWFGALSAEQLDVLGPHSHGPRSAAWFVEQRLAEVAFHRLDLERSLGRQADLDQQTARFLLPMLFELNVPAIVARDKRGGQGSYLLRVRGGPAAAWRLDFAPGALRVSRGGDGAETVLEADPAAFGLLMYGRASLADLERAGRLSVGGDRAAADRFQDLYGGP